MKSSAGVFWGVALAFLAPLAVAEEAGDSAVGADLVRPGPAVSIEIAIVDLKGSADELSELLEAWGDEPAVRLQDLLGSGHLEAYVQIATTTLSGMPAKVQFGEQVYVVSGRTPFPGRSGPGEGVATYTAQQVGTLLEVTPHVEEDGTVATDVTLERSRLAREQDPSAAEALPPPPTQTMTVSTRLIVPSGQTVVVAGSLQAVVDGSAAQTVVLLTATHAGR